MHMPMVTPRRTGLCAYASFNQASLVHLLSSIYASTASHRRYSNIEHSTQSARGTGGNRHPQASGPVAKVADSTRIAHTSRLLASPPRRPSQARTPARTPMHRCIDAPMRHCPDASLHRYTDALTRRRLRCTHPRARLLTHSRFLACPRSLRSSTLLPAAAAAAAARHRARSPPFPRSPCSVPGAHDECSLARDHAHAFSRRSSVLLLSSPSPLCRIRRAPRSVPEHPAVARAHHPTIRATFSSRIAPSLPISSLLLRRRTGASTGSMDAAMYACACASIPPCSHARLPRAARHPCIHTYLSPLAHHVSSCVSSPPPTIARRRRRCVIVCMHAESLHTAHCSLYTCRVPVWCSDDG
ncbi:hypothetical protein GY45DRAFT_297715 [Cubamyces sp. BRFM 1775]|nr:hypothetical protein GY45DRAFT_297715 [Cubamyces sp. BRFM 1775]